MILGEQWQDEVREEIRAHAKTLACNAVIGYTESVNILDDLYILSASGTAVKAAFTSCCLQLMNKLKKIKHNFEKLSAMNLKMTVMTN